MEKSETDNYFKELQNLYLDRFVRNKKERTDILKNKSPVNILSPGRVNIIGEHTDYNLGLSINAAIDKQIFITGYKNNSNYIEVFSRYLNDSGRFSLDNIEFDKNRHWINYIKGVLKEYIQKGHKISGFNIVIDSNLPIGAGISSSASLEVGVAKFIEELFDLKVTRKTMVKLCNSAENDFVGVNCGFMDQFSVAYGKKDCVIFLNFRDLSYEYIPFNLGDNLILIINSKEERNLADTEYNKRRKECNEAVKIISSMIKGKKITSLSDVKPEMLGRLEGWIPEKLFKRARHVITENNRVLRAKENILKGDIKKLGQILFESHNSLKIDYEVSTKRLDYLVNKLGKIKGVYGARLMGAGFGGSVISIVSKDKTDDITGITGKGFSKEFGVVPDFIECKLSDGTGRVVSRD
jgi:galactokinase